VKLAEVVTSAKGEVSRRKEDAVVVTVVDFRMHDDGEQTADPTG
jgi:hypothetical protein